MQAASNAIVAKAYTFYGQRLQEAHYEDLLQCRNVGEIAVYLKNRTAYASVLEGSASATMHRAQLELLLRQHVFQQYAALCHYEVSVGKDFYQYYILMGDLEQISSCLRLLQSPGYDEYLLRMPAFFNQHSRLDLFRLAAAKNFEDVLEATRQTPYYDVLLQFRTRPEVPLSLVEARLQRYLLKTVHTIVQNNFSGKAYEEVYEVLATSADLVAISEIHRLKYLLRAPKDVIQDLVPMEMTLLTKKQIATLIDAGNAHEVLAQVQHTRYARYFPAKMEDHYLEDPMLRALHKYHLRKFRYAGTPAVVMLAYLQLAQNELRNITHIIEGVRYQVPADEIRALLIGAVA